MKVIFLDFDGVLNTPATWGNYVHGDGSEAIDPERVELVNQIADQTGAMVVISSTWRRDRTVKELQELLNKRGATFTVLGKTVDTREERWKQIAKYFEWVNVDRYIILDDTDEAGYGHGDHFIRTDPETGITQSDVERAIRILGEKSNGKS